MKPAVLEQCKNASNLSNIDFVDTKNQIKKLKFALKFTLTPELFTISKDLRGSMKKLAVSKGLINKTEKKKKCLMQKRKYLMYEQVI